MTIAEEIHVAYQNAYNLLIGNTNYDKLAEKALQNEDPIFYLPPNHTDPQVILKYYESIEDYERCAKIVKLTKTCS